MKDDSSENNLIRTIPFKQLDKVVDDEPGNLDYIKEQVVEPYIQPKEEWPLLITPKPKPPKEEQV